MLALTINKLAERQADWLAARQNLLAANIANSNTPGYEARDIAPFSATLDGQTIGLARTAAGHIDVSQAAAIAVRSRRDAAVEIAHSGNSVNVDQQLLKANDVRAEYSVNIGIVRAFNRMLMASVRGQ